MADGNGPTMGEVGRRLDHMDARFSLLDSKIERYANLAVDARLGEFDRRLGTVEATQRMGATQRSSATWQILFVGLGLLGTMAVGVIMALVFGGGG